MGKAIRAVTVAAVEVLPNGVKAAMVQVDSAKDYLKQPKAIEIDGVVYGKTGWNSDSMVAYYRTDAVVAMVIAGYND